MKRIAAQTIRTRPVVLIASHDTQLRARWRRILKGRTLAYEAGDKSKLAHALSIVKPDVLLLDLALHRLGGVHALSWVQQLSPATGIMVFSNVPKITEEICALKLGARGYSKRNIGPSLLAKAVSVVAEGEYWTGRKVIPALLEEVARHAGQYLSAAEKNIPIDQLTARKKEIARLIAKNASNEEIAAKLGITKATVKAHLTEIFRKLNISNRLQLAVLMAAQSLTYTSF